MRRTPLLLLVLGATVLLGTPSGCSNPTAPPIPSAFDRPESVSFFCWDRDAEATVTLSECAPPEGSDDGAPRSPFELHGVVTQTTTGEVAAVQITGDEDHPPGPIDSDIRVPGFTFAAVGEVPSAVVTPRLRPEFTYVVSRGSGTLHVIETNSFRAGLGATVTEKHRGGADDEPFFGRGSRPVSMRLTPLEDALVVAVPVLFSGGAQVPGEVWIVPIDGQTVGDPVRVPLAADVPAAVDLTAIPESELPPEYELRCNLPPSQTALVPPREPVAVGTDPAPTAIAIDDELNRAIVTDTALPILHVIDLETQTEIETFNVGVPTRDIALTPRVPATLESTTPTERFLYAIDDDGDDGLVLAVDYSDPARASYGAVLTVGERDRLNTPFPARALDVATPGYDAADVTFCDEAEDTSPRSLHGVFLAVATNDGRVRIFDVFDLDITCRGIATTCGPGTITTGVDSSDQVVAIGRHRPRIATFLETDDVVSVTEGPTWDLGATDATVGDDGSAASSVPALETLECPAELARVFPEGGTESRVCAVTDPWTATSERYTFAWEGAIPFTSTTGGNFAGDTIEVRFDPCARGVLGSADVPGAGELGVYGGDVVAITGALPPSLTEEERADCESLVQLTSTGETTPVLLPLVSASADADDARDTYPGRLLVGAPIDPPGFTLDRVRSCFPELLRLEVRVSSAFLATSTRAGFRHPVVRGVDGTCEIDPAALAAGQRGRAFLGERFVTPDIAIRFASTPPTADRPVLQLTVGDLPPTLSYDISTDGDTDLPSLIAEVEFNDVDERLYVVDQARRGLIRLDLTDASNPLEAIFR